MKNFLKILLLVCAIMSADVMCAQKTVKVKTDTIRNADGSYTIHTRTMEKELEKSNVDKSHWQVNGLFDNWFVSVSAGPTVYFEAEDSKGSFGKRITPLYEFSVGKWIYPFLGARASFGFGSLSGFSTKRYAPIGPGYYDDTPITPPSSDGTGGLWRQHWTYKEVHVDLLYDLSSKAHFNPASLYHCRAVAGAGISWGDKEKYKADPNRIAAFYIGLNHSLRLSHLFELTCDSRYVITNHTFDREKTNGGIPGYPNINVGLTWNIGARRENKRTGGWRYNIKRTTQSNITDTYISEKEMGTHHVIPGEVYIAPTAVFFELDRYELLPEYKLSLRLVAKQLSECGLTMQLVGSADSATGSAEHNQWLSEKRCEAVREYLIKECGIKASQLQSKPIGGVEVYSPFRLNRAVFILLEDSPRTLKDVEEIKKKHHDKND